MKTFTLKLRELRAMMNFASTNETRWVLNSVCVDARKGRYPLLVATDGRCLGVLKAEAPLCEDTFEAVLPVDLLKVVFKLARRDEDDTTTFRIDEEKRDVTVEFGTRLSVTYYHGIPEGNYPKWRQVVPKFDKNAFAARGRTLSGALLEKFSKAARILYGRNNYNDGTGMCIIGTDEYSACIVRLGQTNDGFFGVLMPMRSDGPVSDREQAPDWLEIDPLEVKPQEPGKATA